MYVTIFTEVTHKQDRNGEGCVYMWHRLNITTNIRDCWKLWVVEMWYEVGWHGFKNFRISLDSTAICRFPPNAQLVTSTTLQVKVIALCYPIWSMLLYIPYDSNPSPPSFSYRYSGVITAQNCHLQSCPGKKAFKSLHEYVYWHVVALCK